MASLDLVGLGFLALLVALAGAGAARPWLLTVLSLDGIIVGGKL